ncbi:MAG: response regulator [Pseudooceanicola sp.]|nr:response regulator [Pseudooceanicola sp.]
MDSADRGDFDQGVNAGASVVRFRGFLRLAAGLLIAGSAMVLVFGWLLGIETFVRVRADYPAMVPETALVLMLGGIGLALTKIPAPRVSARSAGLLIVVVTASALVAPVNSEMFGKPDGFSIATSICSLLGALALLLWDTNDRAGLRNLRIMAESAGLLLASVCAIGYLLNAEALFAHSLFTRMSLLTTIGFLLFFVALLLRDPHQGWIQVLLAPESGSRLLRRLLPFMVFIPLLFFAFVEHSVGLGRDDEFRVAILTFSISVSVAMSAIFFTYLTNQSERRAQHARMVLLDSERARQAAELALSRSQRIEAMGKLVGGVAHDFNNSLTVIVGNLELLAEDPDPEARESYVKDAITASSQAAHLTRQLLAYGRKSRLEALPNSIDDLCETTLAMFRRICPSNIDIHTDLNAGRVVVLLDSANFQQALLNVLINARDAMEEEPGEIFVSTRATYLAAPTLSGYSDDGRLNPGNYVKLAVRDTGHGMDRATMEQATEPFFTTKEVGEGTGLGLSAVAGFCRQSGGGLRLESEPGVGTTVMMAFPQSSRLAAGGRLPHVEEDGPVSASRILIVDDEPGITRVMARQLQLDGHVVRVAQDAEQALSILEVEPLPDLIITDLMMPGPIQGNRLSEIIHDRYPGAKVLLMSGYESERRRNKLAETQAIAFLQKPIDRATLRVAVGRALAEK